MAIHDEPITCNLSYIFNGLNGWLGCQLFNEI